MKSVKPLIGLILVCSCFFAHAQRNAPAYVSSIDTFADHSRVTLNDPYGISDNSEQDFKNDVPGLTMMRVGNGLIIGGTILTVTGVFLMVTADELYYRTYKDSDGNTISEGDAKGALGVLLTAGGVGMIIPGAIFYTKGKKKYKASQHTTANFSLGINRNGAGLRFRF